MQDQISELKLLIEASEVSHEKCAELITMLTQAQFYIAFKAQTGDLYAQNLKSQIMKEGIHA